MAHCAAAIARWKSSTTQNLIDERSQRMEKIRVILVDDHQILREGIEFLLSNEPDIELVGQAGNGRELIDMLPHSPTDLVLLDLHMPEMDGYETTRYLAENNPEVRILILSM